MPGGLLANIYIWVVNMKIYVNNHNDTQRTTQFRNLSGEIDLIKPTSNKRSCAGTLLELFITLPRLCLPLKASIPRVNTSIPLKLYNLAVPQSYESRISETESCCCGETYWSHKIFLTCDITDFELSKDKITGWRREIETSKVSQTSHCMCDKRCGLVKQYSSEWSTYGDLTNQPSHCGRVVHELIRS